MQIEQYRANTIGVIAQALKGYVGHKAIISELLQNADDADSEFVSFHFHYDRLEVHNDKYFTEKDWNSIGEIASGGKHDEEGKIGTFGTGFISVYHITDQPHIFSAGLHKIIYPLSGEIALEEYPIGKETIFHFPWRREDSELSQRIESPIWDKGRIEEFLGEVTEFIPEAFLFLRHVRNVEVFDGKDLIVSIKRKIILNESTEDHEVWQIEQDQQSQKWLYYHTQNQRDTPGNLKIKDRRVSLAFPIHGEPINGKLYNFLPTQITTGFAFHINGAFFPDNNRRGILDDKGTNEHRTKWNHFVIETAAELFANAITDIRDHIAEHSQSTKDFYQLWPQKKPSDGYNLATVRERFIEKAKTSAIIYSSLGHWEHPDHVWIASTSNLYDLSSDYLDLIPDSGKGISWFASENLDTKTLTLRGMLIQIKDRLEDNLLLSEAHPIINTRQRLEMLYKELPQRGESDFDWIRQQPIFLSESGTLVASAQLWRARGDTRNLFKPDGRPLFADIEFESQWPEVYVAPFIGAELVDWLWEWEQSHPEDVFFQSKNHLKRVLEVIAQDIKRVDHEKLKHLYIVLAEGGDGWYSSEGNIFFAKAQSEYDLGLPNLLLVKRSLAQDAKAKRVFENAGIQSLQVHDVIDFLEEMLEEGLDFNNLNLVQRLYRYFGKEQVSPDEIEQLKGLPLFQTAGGRWTTLTQQPDLSLKPRLESRVKDEVSYVLNKLQLDNYIHPELENETKFLGKVGIKPLDELTFNRHLVERYYASRLLSHEDKFILLEYLRDSVFEYHADLITVMQNTHLILCDDGKYRSASEVYFASPVLDDVFDRAYTRPHPSYDLEIATNQDEEQRPYHQNKWYRFFSQLGMSEEPSPQDVIDRIQQLVAGQPNSVSIESVGRIVGYLNGLSQENQISYSVLSSVAWLPAQGDNKIWNLPSEIYEKRHEKLIGQQAPLLRFEVRLNLRRILDIPEQPDGELVARHLLSYMDVKRAVDSKVYGHLGEHWQDISSSNRQRIQSEPSIWDMQQNHYWHPSECFIGDEEQQFFGTHRHYLNDADENIARFYKQVQIDTQATNQQRLEFLRELVNHSPLSDYDLQLLHTNLELIGLALKVYTDIVNACKLIRIVPDESGNMHRPENIVRDDQRVLRDKLVDMDLPFVRKDFLTEATIKFWDAIGVIRLSSVKPLIKEIKGKQSDDELKQKLVDRIPYFQRVVYHSQGKRKLDYDLNFLGIFVCQSLEIKYQILGKESSSHHEDVVFDRAANKLYHVQDINQTRLALELAHILDLENTQSSLIQQILIKQLAQIETYLNELELQPLPQETSGATVPNIPLASPGEFSSDGFSEDAHYNQQDQVDEIEYNDEEIDDELINSDRGNEDKQYQNSGSASGWGSSPHAPHYPNNPLDLVERFGVDQEYPELPTIDFLNVLDEEDFDFEEELGFTEEDFPVSWKDVFVNEPESTWSNLSSRFNQSSSRDILTDAYQIQRQLPKLEDRRGVFQIICETFPHDDAVLHIQDIRSAVWKRRIDIAEGTISSILSRARPCFESLGDAYWVFHAKYIQAGYANLNEAISLYGRWAYSQKRQNHLRTTNHTDRAKRVQSQTRNNSPAKLSGPNEVIPSDELDIVLISGLLVNLETFLEYIPSDTQERQHDIIRRTAQITEQEQHYDLSLVLYELLHKRGIKGFENKIQELQQRVPLTEIAQRIASIPPNDPKRWNIWLEAWQRYPELISLRDTIRKNVKLTSSSVYQTVNEFIRDATEEAAQEYIEWLKLIYPFWSAWYRDEMVVLGESLPLVFDLLMQNEYFELAVELIASCPADSRLLRDAKFTDMNRYLYAVSVITDWLLQHKRQKSANVLRAYGLYVAKNSGQRLIDIKEIEQKVRSSQVSIDDLRDAEQDTSIQNWINLQTLKKMIEQYQ